MRKFFLGTLFLLIIWLPLEAIFLTGLGQAQDAFLEAASAIRQRELSARMMKFRKLLQPEEILTIRLREICQASFVASGPKAWEERVLEGFSDFPSGSLNLFVTDGKSLFPSFPGFDPATLSAFLATCTVKADSISSTKEMLACIQRLRKDFDYMGNERFSVFQWIQLPLPPGIPNRILDRAWHDDTVFFGYNTHRNSWAAFGHAGRFEGWRYLLVFHRQYLPEQFLFDLSLREARKRGLDVSIYKADSRSAEKVATTGATGEAASGARIGSASGSRLISGLLKRNGRMLTLSDFDEKFGFLEVRGELPLSLWTVWCLALLANGAFSLVGIIVLFGSIANKGELRVSVTRRISLGLLAGTGFPFLMALVVGHGMLGTKAFRDIQTHLVDMEKEMRGVEEDFNRYLDIISRDYRALDKHFRVPFESRTGIPPAERICASHEADVLFVIDPDGKRLLTRGPYTWQVYHLAMLPAKDRSDFLLERIPRGAFFLEHELRLLTLNASIPIHERDLEARKILFNAGRNARQLFNSQMFSIISRMVCQGFDRGSAITTRDVEESKSGLLLNLFLQGREVEVLNETISRLGTLSTFKMSGYEGLSFVDVAKDSKGKAGLVILIFHRLASVCDQFLRARFRHPSGKKIFDLGALSIEPLKLDFGPVLPPVVTDLMRTAIQDTEKPVSFLLDSEPSGYNLILAKRSARLPSHILFIKVPFSRLSDGSLKLSRWLGSGMLLLFLLVAGVGLALRRVFLKPLYNLKKCVNVMARPESEAIRAAPALGEMGILADLFNQTLDGLRQMNIARAVQENLLPSGGLRAGQFVIKGHSVMMSQVGGDYYDLLPVGPERVLVVVGDVAGHGLPAAIVMAMLKSGLTVLSKEPLGVDEIARELNEILLRLLARARMMTCFLGCLNPITGAFSFTNAGHNYPLLLPSSGESRYLKQTNLPLGSLKNRSYKKDEVVLNPGDTLIICTDGILEALDPLQKMLGYEGFRQWFAAGFPSDPEKLIELVMEGVERFTDGAPPQDDLTLLVVCRRRNTAVRNQEAGTPS